MEGGSSICCVRQGFRGEDGEVGGHLVQVPVFSPLQIEFYFPLCVGPLAVKLSGPRRAIEEKNNLWCAVNPQLIICQLPWPKCKEREK